jgi:hypothetical protein
MPAYASCSSRLLASRTTMIELAWMWARYQPDSALSRWFRQRVGSERGRTRRYRCIELWHATTA